MLESIGSLQITLAQSSLLSKIRKVPGNCGFTITGEKQRQLLRFSISEDLYSHLERALSEGRTCSKDRIGI